MKTMKTLGAGIVLAAGTFASTAAMAEVSANLGVASEYVFRGLPSSGGGAQVHGGLDWSQGNAYAGVWASNSAGGTGAEVDFYGGYNFGMLDVGLIAYMFPADPEIGPATATSVGSPGHGNALEVYLGVNSGPFSAYAWYNMGTDVGPSSAEDTFVYVEGNVDLPLNDKASVGVHLGLTSFEASAADEQIDWGVTLNVGDMYVGVTGILENDNTLDAFERPRINVGYSWSFDDVL